RAHERRERGLADRKDDLGEEVASERVAAEEVMRRKRLRRMADELDELLAGVVRRDRACDRSDDPEREEESQSRDSQRPAVKTRESLPPGSEARVHGGWCFVIDPATTETTTRGSTN